MGDLDRVRFGGEIVDRRTSNMLREAQRIANEHDPSIGKLRLSQGCFCHGVAASAGTHSGAGAFDLSVRGYSESQKEVIALSLRKVGFASWRRMPNQGPWPEHIHGIAIGSKQLPPIAQNQVRSYLNGRDGLVGNRRDHQDRPDKILTWEQYKAKHPDDDKPDAKLPEDSVSDRNAASADPYDIDAGQGVSMTKDSDRDGLTDDFEKMTRTNPFALDSDGDGITDGQEFISSGGRGMGVAIDTDHDGVADWLETAAQNRSSQVARASATATNGRQDMAVGAGVGSAGLGTPAAGASGIGTSGSSGIDTSGSSGIGTSASSGIGTSSTGGIGTGAPGGLGTGVGVPIGTGSPLGLGSPVGGGLPPGATGDDGSALDGTGGDPLN